MDDEVCQTNNCFNKAIITVGKNSRKLCFMCVKQHQKKNGLKNANPNYGYAK